MSRGTRAGVPAVGLRTCGNSRASLHEAGGRGLDSVGDGGHRMLMRESAAGTLCFRRPPVVMQRLPGAGDVRGGSLEGWWGPEEGGPTGWTPRSWGQKRGREGGKATVRKGSLSPSRLRPGCGGQLFLRRWGAQGRNSRMLGETVPEFVELEEDGWPFLRPEAECGESVPGPCPSLCWGLECVPARAGALGNTRYQRASQNACGSPAAMARALLS